MTTAVDSSPPKTELLFTGAIGDRNDAECVARLSKGTPEETNVLFLSYERPPDELFERWRSRVGDDPAEFGVITVGAEPGESADSEPDQNVVSVVRPDCLGRLQTTILLYLDQWSANDHPTILCFDSVTALLRNINRATAFRFLHTLVETLRVVDVVAHFHMETDAHDEETITMFQSLFDAVVDEPPDTGSTLSPDVLLALFDSRRRRLVCRSLAEAPDRTDVSAIAEQIARWESPGTPSEDSLERVHITLHHVHLPKLVEARVVERNRESVTATVGTAELEQYVRLTSGDDETFETKPPLPNEEKFPVTTTPKDDSDEAYWTVYGTAPDSVVVTLARALGTVFDVDATSLQTVLYDVVDVDALQRLAEREGTSVYATFQYGGYEVVVDGGEIRLYESGD